MIVKANLDPNEFEFPFFYDSEEKYKKHLLGYSQHVDKSSFDETTNTYTQKYLSDWERELVEKYSLYNPHYDNLIYTCNKYGFRGINTFDDINSDSIVCSGCSNTFGMGSYEEEIWPVLAFGDSNVNLGYPALGPNAMIRELIAVLDFKTPKAIAINFSTIDRTDYLMQTERGVDSTNLGPGLIGKGGPREEAYRDWVLGCNEYMSHLIFLNAFNGLIEKCLRLNVDLIVTSWSPYLYPILSKYSNRGYKVAEYVPFKHHSRSRDKHHYGLSYHQAVADSFTALVGS